MVPRIFKKTLEITPNSPSHREKRLSAEQFSLKSDGFLVVQQRLGCRRPFPQSWVATARVGPQGVKQGQGEGEEYISSLRRRPQQRQAGKAPVRQTQVKDSRIKDHEPGWLVSVVGRQVGRQEDSMPGRGPQGRKEFHPEPVTF